MLDLRDYDFPLPDERIARFPATPRDSARLLVARRFASGVEHRVFRELGELLRAGDVLVLNQTKVLKARLYGENTNGRKFEVLLLAPEGERATRWRCLARPGRAVATPGTRLLFAEGCAADIRRSPHDDRQFEIDFPAFTPAEFHGWLERNGHMPLPPYLKREANAEDARTYQTVYAQNPGSVAAPTAGLHFTPELMESLKTRGVAFETLDLTIGYGTFSPVEPDATQLHAEPYRIDPDVDQRLHAARAEGRRVIAVGTTSLRALEASATGERSGVTRLFIRPGYAFQRVDGLITNFHLPQSSLFILIAAFMGLPEAQAAYAAALAGDYRFFSYGDAMAIL